MKDLGNLNLDPDRLTFVAGLPSFDEHTDLEDDFQALIGIGMEDVFDTPEHLHEPKMRRRPGQQQTVRKPRLVE